MVKKYRNNLLSIIMKKKLIIFLIIVIILAIAGYWYYQQRIFSKSILKLEILGIEEAQIGEEIKYTVRYKNNSDFTLEEPKLTFEYPEYTINDEGKTIVSKVLKDIYPGDEQFVQFKGRLLGKENGLKVANARLSYRPKNMKPRYESNTTFTTKITAAPLTLDFDLPSKLERGKEIQFSINYFSNVDCTLSGLRIDVEYPGKFEFISAEPQSLDKNEWDIGELSKAQGGRIKITGSLTEEAGKQLEFKVRFGIWKEGEYVLLKETTKNVEVVEPQLYISQQVNGSSSYIASPGEELHYEIYFRNIGNTPFENLFLTNSFNSSVFDLSTLRVDKGDTRIDDNMAVWDWKQVPELKYLDAQKEGKVEFGITLKSSWPPSETDVNATVIGNRINISQINQDFQIKVNSKLVILQKGFYQDSTFNNSGPFPPVAGQATTYTITWQIQNLYNNVKNVKVRAILPQGVNLTGRISPESEISKLSFDSTSREIVWTGPVDMVAGIGASDTNQNISFQVSLFPDSSQRGQVLPIINKAKITAEDQWTGVNTEAESLIVDTTLPDDASVTNHSGIVQ
ncbi:hypothetical protein KJ786_00670 [Patescibacteria group bacterium]|nr:hypothetical protein [Patescibacteria group bacterium]